MKRMMLSICLATALASVVVAAQQPTPPASEAERLPEERRVKAEDIDKLLSDGKVFFLDVREPWELEKLGTLEGYVNIPIGELEKRLDELPRDKAILTA